MCCNAAECCLSFKGNGKHDIFPMLELVQFLDLAFAIGRSPEAQDLNVNALLVAGEHEIRNKDASLKQQRLWFTQEMPAINGKAIFQGGKRFSEGLLDATIKYG